MILRTTIAAIAVLLLVVVGLAAIEQPAARGPAIVLAILTVAIVVENRRYRSGLGASAAFKPTAERFVDPETGQKMRVWTGPEGERRYVPDETQGVEG